MFAPPRLRTLFALLGLLTFALPLFGLALLRVSDNQLVRQTESELVAQGAFVVAAYRASLVPRLAAAGVTDYGHPLPAAALALHDPPTQPFTPVAARLNVLRAKVRPRAEPARPPAVPADAHALAAGAALEPVMRQAQRVSLAGIRIVDPRGTVVATTREEGGLSLGHREEVARALAGGEVAVVLLRERVSDDPAPPLSSISRGTGVRVFVALPVVHAGRVLGAVVLARTPQSLGKAFYEDRRYLGGAALVLLLVVLTLAWLASAFLVRPLGALTRQAGDVAAGRRAPAPLRHAGTAEVARLSAAFSRMAKTLEERADYIRSFATAVSHEFKTPLTALRGTIELLREHAATMPEVERARFLDNLAEDTGRLDRLVRRLLELARADVALPSAEAHPVLPVLEACVARHRQDGRSVDLSADGSAALAVHMAPDLLGAVVGNLVENALVHGGPAARVWLTLRREGDALAITVENDGRPLSAGNADRAFDPFFTTARDHGGTGLGLTIARSLLRAHGGDVVLASAGGEPRTRFVVRLPLQGAAGA